MLRSIKQHQALLGTRDGGVEPAVAILGGAAQTVVVDDDVVPGTSLRLMGRNGVAPDSLDQPPHCFH